MGLILKCKKCNKTYEFNDKDINSSQECPYCNGKKEMSKDENAQYVPKCPTCQSPDIVKLTYTQKAVSVGLFGIFSGRAKKTFHCNSCKYEW